MRVVRRGLPTSYPCGSSEVRELDPSRTSGSLFIAFGTFRGVTTRVGSWLRVDCPTSGAVLRCCVDIPSQWIVAVCNGGRSLKNFFEVSSASVTVVSSEVI